MRIKLTYGEAVDTGGHSIVLYAGLESHETDAEDKGVQVTEADTEGQPIVLHTEGAVMGLGVLR